MKNIRWKCSYYPSKKSTLLKMDWYFTTIRELDVDAKDYKIITIYGKALKIVIASASIPMLCKNMVIDAS